MKYTKEDKYFNCDGQQISLKVDEPESVSQEIQIQIIEPPIEYVNLENVTFNDENSPNWDLGFMINDTHMLRHHFFLKGCLLVFFVVLLVLFILGCVCCIKKKFYQNFCLYKLYKCCTKIDLD